MPENVNAWYIREHPLPEGRWAVTCHLGPHRDDGALVDKNDRDDAAPVLWAVDAGERGRLHVRLAPSAAPDAPACWFVLVPEPKANPPATNLVAFADERFAPGTVVSNYTFAALRVSSADQAAAVRWYPASGVVHQIFVAPEWRRRQLGTALLYAASAVH